MRLVEEGHEKASRAHIAAARVEAVRLLPNVYVAGVTSQNPRRARRFADAHGLRAYVDLAEALTDDAERARMP